MSKTEKLVPGDYYHIFNRGINGCDIFRDVDNYSYFMTLYDKYIEPVVDTYAWVLMRNHFHFLVKIPTITDLSGHKNLEGLKTKPPHQHFSNLFNAYTKAFNKRYERTGSLFEKNFHRKQINSVDYLKQVVIYIHQNPVHHRFCETPSDYPWSSFLTCVSLKETKLNRDTVVGWFDNLGNFTYLHKAELKKEKIENWLRI